METTKDFFGTEIKTGDLVIFTVTVNRNPTSILGRVANVSRKTHENGWTNHTISVNSISDPNSGPGWLADMRYNEAGRVVKCGQPNRMVVVNDLRNALETAAEFEPAAIQMEENRKDKAHLEKLERVEERKKDLLKEARKSQAKMLHRKQGLSKLSKQEKRALGL